MLREKTIKRLDDVALGFPSRRWAHVLLEGRESSNRLSQNGWIWLANGSIRKGAGSAVKQTGTALATGAAQANVLGGERGAGGWARHEAPSSPGARLTLHLPLLTKGIGKGRSSG